MMIGKRVVTGRVVVSFPERSADQREGFRDGESTARGQLGYMNSMQRMLVGSACYVRGSPASMGVHRSAPGVSFPRELSNVSTTISRDFDPGPVKGVK